MLQDEGSRRRMRVLAHLPLTATFKLCEVDLSGGVPLACVRWTSGNACCEVNLSGGAHACVCWTSGDACLPDWDCK